MKHELQELVGKVARDLIRVYAGSGAAEESGLVFPRLRNGTLRISEQEARLLFVRHVTMDGRFRFAVETPTSRTYRQTGKTDISARVDLTLFGPDRQPLVNIELKAHNCRVEDIRKDLEKLVREKTTGAWFHTLEKADARTLAVLMGKFKAAFRLLSCCLATSDGSYLMSFCALDPGILFWKWLEFSGDLDRNFAAIDTVFDGRGLESWTTLRFGGDRPAVARAASRGKGVREGFFVYAPGIVAGTFLHLSVRGGSYRLRNFLEAGPAAAARPFTVPGLPTVDALRTSGLIAQYLPVTAEDASHSLEREPAYWCARVGDVNTAALLEAVP